MATEKEKQEKILNQVKPPLAVAAKKDLSNWQPKDSIFNKEKTVIDKKTNQQKKIPADWRKLHVGGEDIVLHKGQALTKEQFAKFDKDATKYYLEEIKK